MKKIQNPEKEYPLNMGKKWTDEEESLLLEELNKNMDIEIISQIHKRTIGGINSRRREIAYKMYLKKIYMEEIIKQTKLDYECIRETIERRQNNNKRKKIGFSMESEIAEIKNEIKYLKNTTKELVEIMKSVYG